MITDHVKTIFCNGVANTYEDARRGAKAIGQIMGRPVECFYNNAHHDLLFGTTTALAGTGLSLLAAHPLPLMIVGSRSQSLVERRKTQCAAAMAEKIRTDLQNHPLNQVVLVLHSQGRDIGDLALRRLSRQERQRISVVTLGSSPIAEKAAAKVTNLQQKGDLVPAFMKLRDSAMHLINLNFFPSKREIHSIEGNGHSLASYLRHPHVQRCLMDEHSRSVQKVAEQAQIKI